MQETQETQAGDQRDTGSIPGQEDPLQVELATHSSILAWKIPQRRLAGYSPWGRKESDTTEHAHGLSKDYCEGSVR